MTAAPAAPTGTAPPTAPRRLAIIGAGPVGLATALLAAQRCPGWRIEVFDARPRERDVRGDPRTLALSLGSVQLLERLQAWPAADAEPIRQIHVSQTPPQGLLPGSPAVTLDAATERVPLLGAVLAYGSLLAPLQARFLALADASPAAGDDAAAGVVARFGLPVTAAEPVSGGAGVDVATGDGRVRHYDAAVIAEGGVFAEQPHQAVTRDYGQTAWVGTVTLADAEPGRAIERFTRDGPLALLPLPRTAGAPLRAALVWCVPTRDDPVRALDDAQRIAVLNSRLPAEAGRVTAVSPLKGFALGLNAEGRSSGGRLRRIGNAAQTLHPVAGQGLNLGLRDAWRMVDVLAAAGPRPDDALLDAALHRLGSSRAPDRWRTILTTDLLARAFTWQAPGLATARGAALGLLQALPPLKSALARQMMFGWR